MSKQEVNGLNMAVCESSVIFYAAAMTSTCQIHYCSHHRRSADCLAEMSAAARRTVRSGGGGGTIIFSAAAARRDRPRALLYKLRELSK